MNIGGQRTLANFYAIHLKCIKNLEDFMGFDVINNFRRVVVKVGTSSVMQDAQKIDYRKLERLAYVLSTLQQEGYEMVLVSSGAVGVGASMMGYGEYPREIPVQQAMAAVGQGELIALYSQFFNYYNQAVGQVLLTRDVVDFPESLNNVKSSLSTLMDYGIIPIINENDAVSVEEMNHHTKFGDNDNLSAMVAEIVDADLLVIMSDVDGLYTDNPNNNPEAELIPHVREINEETYQMATGKGSKFASGGMTTKLQAAERMLNNDKSMIIMASHEVGDLLELLLDGVEIGTLFSK